jgi:hypothetical protein
VGWSTSHFLLQMHPPDAADNSPLLPQIDIDSIELWRWGEGELFVSLASYFDRNSPSCLLISPLLQLPPQILTPGAQIAPQLLVPIDIDSIDLKQRLEGEFLVCFCFEPHPKLTNYFRLVWSTSGRRQPRPLRVWDTSQRSPRLLVYNWTCKRGGRNKGEFIFCSCTPTSLIK